MKKNWNEMVEIERMRQSGAIPPNQTVMDEMKIIRGLLERSAAQRPASPQEVPAPASVPEPAPVAAEPEPKIVPPTFGFASPGPAVDCSVEPFIPDGWEIRPGEQIATRFRGKLIWTPDCIGLHLDDGQKGGKVIGGEDLKKRLEGLSVLPANVLDWQLEDPETRIPDSWKGKWTCYWGTVYRNRYCCPVVRCLFWWSGGRWVWSCGWLDYGWRGLELAAIPASV